MNFILTLVPVRILEIIIYSHLIYQKYLCVSQSRSNVNILYLESLGNKKDFFFINDEKNCGTLIF